LTTCQEKRPDSLSAPDNGYQFIWTQNGGIKMGTIAGIVALICAVWVIYDVLVNNKGLSSGMKVVWIVCAVLFSIITAIVYYLVEKNK
jgi:hypothetical protein